MSLDHAQHVEMRVSTATGMRISSALSHMLNQHVRIPCMDDECFAFSHCKACGDHMDPCGELISAFDILEGKPPPRE